tara:strand:+ start:2011 stop:2967 length:957 start_codon:yes stop_codon:yes gene_type:complete
LNISNRIIQYRKEINFHLTKIYSKGPVSLLEPVNYVLNGGGKRLRSLLTILTTEACGGVKEDVFSSALAVEVLHNFTLVHDDIMDQDSIRHGQDTVHEKWDDGVAILTGDAMLSLALKLINQSPKSSKQIEIFIDGLLAVCEGQALDKEFETDRSINIEKYIKMIDLKTGYMIGLASHIGAIAVDSIDKDTSESLRDYGRLIGRAFQIQDDYLEIFSDSKGMGKSLQSDILLGKKTFLMIKALQHDEKFVRDSLILAKSDFKKGIQKIREYITSSGIKEFTKREINNLINIADKKLSSLNIDNDKLLYFSDLIRKRGN